MVSGGGGGGGSRSDFVGKLCGGPVAPAQTPRTTGYVDLLSTNTECLQADPGPLGRP